MTTLTTNTPLSTPARKAAKPVINRGKFDASVDKDELQFIFLALGIIGGWVGATALFGYAGLIICALLMVAALYTTLVFISRG